MNSLNFFLINFKRFFLLLMTASCLLLQATDKDEILSIINDIEYGWENGDGEPFSKHFLDYEGAKYFESGGQNIGLKDLIENHVEPEKDALYFLELNFLNIDIRIDQSFAWVTADTEVKGKVKRNDYEFDKTGHQTFLLKKLEGRWKILHTHSSSRDRRKNPKNVDSKSTKSKPIETKPATEPIKETFGLPEKKETAITNKIRSKFLSVKQLSNKKVDIKLENGQVWRSVEAVNRGELSKLKSSNSIEISEALISGYVLKAEGKKLSIRVRRIK